MFIVCHGESSMNGYGIFNLSFEIIHFQICDTVHLKDLQVPFEDSEDLSPMDADVMPCYFGGEFLRLPFQPFRTPRKTNMTLENPYFQ